MKYDSIYHFVARIRPGSASLCKFECGLWLWNHLRRIFPDALGATLMHNHLHLVSQVHDVPAAYRSLRVTLGHFTRVFQEITHGWMPLEAPSPVQNTQKLLRNLRYLALNPCRARLTPDPLCWFWSTHRDVMGAVADPWINAERLASVLQWRMKGFQNRYHAHVSSDPSVAVEGTPPPQINTNTRILRPPIVDLVQAAAMASRTNPIAISLPGMPRTLLVHMALQQGWNDRKLLMNVINASKATLKRIIAGPPGKMELHAGLLCLADPRLFTS